MTTFDEAMAQTGPAGDEVADEIRALVRSPLVRVWPEVDPHERAVLTAASQLAKVLDILCTTEDGEFNALVAYQALQAAGDHLGLAIPDDVSLEGPRADAVLMARTLRARGDRYETLSAGDVVGVLSVGGRRITITKLG